MPQRASPTASCRSCRTLGDEEKLCPTSMDRVGGLPYRIACDAKAFNGDLGDWSGIAPAASSRRATAAGELRIARV